jgi:hypothetical protein
MIAVRRADRIRARGCPVFNVKMKGLQNNQTGRNPMQSSPSDLSPQFLADLLCLTAV